MANMCPTKTPMPTQEPDVRNKNFEEVATGYTLEMAQGEAARCLHCKNMPCVSGCPVNVQIPDFIKKIVDGDLEGAYQVISSTNALPAISGRVCPQESQCESKCVRGIKTEPVGIGRLERFVADWHRENVEEHVEKPDSNGHKVAVVGSGPSGLTCAADLAKQGYQVTVFEAFHTAGGVLVYGIPEFRLPKAIVAGEVDKLKALGVEIMTDMVMGKVLSIDELMDDMGYEAVFIGTGAGLPRFMNIPGEGLAGVCSANEYLTRINLMKGYLPEYDTPVIKSKAVAVVGGGNVAMDACRCAKRMGAEHVYIVYRRSEVEMPARNEEIEHAKEEGIEFLTLCNPVEIIGGVREDGKPSGRVAGCKCIRMELGEPDASGRRRPIEVPGSEFVLDVDTVIMALGTSPNPLIRSTTPGLEANRRGCLVVGEDDVSTTRTGVFAGGDAVTGAATVILAMGAGKKAAAAMDKYIQNK
ncbi:MAG: NADPH-dependent glutamate synthase [Clostridiales bacterium]|nr:NADPH-dependent glutamate synthase [Clostridiales bacterium]